MPHIEGHSSQRSALFQLLQRDTLPSTLLFTGPDGIGKSLVAREIAATLVCEAPPEDRAPGGCGECAGCLLTKASNHPDLQILECGGEDFSIDHLRELLYSLNLKSFRAPCKVAILNDADALSTQSANLLLKSLEEPRPATYFILIAANPTRLPKTLLSRAQRWFFDHLGEEEITRVMRARGETIGEGERVLADGSLSQLATMRQHAELWDRIRTGLRGIIGGETHVAVSMAQELGSSRDELPTTLAILRLIARQELLRSAVNPLEAARWSWFLWNVLDCERIILERNLNAVHTLRVLFVELSQRQGVTFTTIPNSVTLFPEVL